MKTFTAFILLAALAVSSTAGARPHESLASAAARGGRELAHHASADFQKRDDADKEWSRVLRHRKGAEVRVITKDRYMRDGRLGDVTDDRVVLLSVSELPPAARRALLDVAANHPGHIGRKLEFTHEKLRIDTSGVYYDGVRVADLGSVFTEIPRADIAELKRPSKGSLPGALVGMGGGVALGFLNAVRLAYKPCGGGCGGEKAAIGLSLVGLPVLGAYLGGRYTPHARWTTVYRSR